MINYTPGRGKIMPRNVFNAPASSRSLSNCSHLLN